jgi:hypothetical protein
MGRIRIKKKSAVIPLMETLAFRMILVIVLIAAGAVTLFRALASYAADGLSPTTVIWIAAALIIAASTYYNIERLKSARVPAATMKRMKRR